jgi:hypothetical protein
MSGNKIYNPAIRHRQSIRMPGYDYSHPGAYFITICTHDRNSLFSEIVNGEMKLCECVILPDHFYGIIILDDVRQVTARRAPIIDVLKLSAIPTNHSSRTINRNTICLFVNTLPQVVRDANLLNQANIP